MQQHNIPDCYRKHIINHGIPDEVINMMLKVAEEFFKMPVEDRMKYYSDDPSRKIRLSTIFNIHKEQVFNWWAGYFLSILILYFKYSILGDCFLLKKHVYR